ncbi:MAG: hypothetical protein K6E10_00995 [Eubacterium sp.]|nr:hypothetical protein [Eubacterium sp.]
MAEQYTLIDDIIKNHSERILNLRKFYPFFTLAEGTFNQYKDGRFRFLDMGYITLAVLRYFINENSFSDSPVKYKGYERFCMDLLQRDFDMKLKRAGIPETENAINSVTATNDIYYASEEMKELVKYIFDKIRNNGRAFEMNFYDPAKKKMSLVRVRLIDSIVRESEVEYTITEDGIEFYLTTKEIRDESRINMDQLLLEKLIKSENFHGSLDVIERINIEVKALDKKREEVVQLLLTDVHAGTAAVDEYMDRTAVWFAEERKSFAKNRELIDKAVARISYGDTSQTARDITNLQNMLKQTIESHSELIMKAAELSKFSDEMVRRSRTRSLRASFDYETLLGRIIREDRPELMELLVAPFLLPRREKSLAINTIDNVILQKTGDSMKGEIKEVEKPDLNFKYDDELLSENMGRNFAKLFMELLGRLRRWNSLTLEEYNAILEVKFGKDIYKNRDYYSFLTHLAGKTEYSVKAIREDAETFLEEVVLENIPEEKLDQYKDMSFVIEFTGQSLKLGVEANDKLAEITGMRFISK